MRVLVIATILLSMHCFQKPAHAFIQSAAFNVAEIITETATETSTETYEATRTALFKVTATDRTIAVLTITETLTEIYTEESDIAPVKSAPTENFACNAAQSTGSPVVAGLTALSAILFLLLCAVTVTMIVVVVRLHTKLRVYKVMYTTTAKEKNESSRDDTYYESVHPTNQRVEMEENPAYQAVGTTTGK